MTCILCLGVSDLLRYLETDPSSLKTLLAEVLPEVSVELADDFTTVCETCTAKLEELKEFKRQCFAVEQRVRQCSQLGAGARDAREEHPASILDVFFRHEMSRVEAGHSVCRACFRPSPIGDSNSLLGNTTHAVFLASLFHKLDLSLTANPILCRPCSARAEEFYQFQQKCLLVQETLKDQAFQDQLLMSGEDPAGGLESTGDAEHEETLNATRSIEELMEYEGGADEDADGGGFPDEEDYDIEEYLNLIAAEAESRQLSLKGAIGDGLADVGFVDGHDRLSPATLDRLCSTAVAAGGKTLDTSDANEDEDDAGVFPRSDGDEDAAGHVETLRCSSCGFSTGTKRGLRRHVRLAHRRRDQLTTTATTTRHACLYCEFTTKAEASLDVHVKMEHDRTWTVHRCDQCDFASKWRTVLETHNVLKHDLERRLYRCPYCKFRTADRQDYRRHHNVRHHDGVRTYDCLYCEYKTRFKYHLKTHVRSKHDVSTANVFRCSVCGYRTKWRSSLLMHGKFKHGGENEVYECVRCDFKTKKLSRLKIHRKLEHEITDPLAYIEFRAELKTRSRARQLELQLQRRRRQREGRPVAVEEEDEQEQEQEQGSDSGQHYRCDQCSYTARRRDTLQRHVSARHDNEKGEFYACSQCSYRSKRKDALKRHVDVKHPKYAE